MATLQVKHTATVRINCPGRARNANMGITFADPDLPLNFSGTTHLVCSNVCSKVKFVGSSRGRDTLSVVGTLEPTVSNFTLLIQTVPDPLSKVPKNTSVASCGTSRTTS